MCGDPTAPALRITFFAFTFTISLYLFLKHMPLLCYLQNLNCKQAHLLKLLNFSITYDQVTFDALHRSPLNTVRSNIPKPSWQNPLISSVSLYPASFPALIKANESGSLGMLLCTFNGPDHL